MMVCMALENYETMDVCKQVLPDAAHLTHTSLQGAATWQI